jgi:hypothetical protein
MREAVKDRASLVMAAVLLLLVGIEFLLVPHDYPRFPWHHVPGYAAMIGLFACLIVVQLSKALGAWLLQRPERDDD